MIKQVFFFVAFLRLLSGVSAQTDFPALKQQFLDYRKADKQDSAMYIARKMNRLALKELSDSSYWYALSLRYQGNPHDTWGNKDSTIFYWQKSVELFEKYHSESIDFASSLNNLGVFYYKLKNFSLAELLLQKSIDLRKKSLGEFHPEYAMSLNNLAGLYSEMNNYNLAMLCYNECINIYKKLYGEEHLDLASCLNNLGNLYMITGNYKSAEIYYRQSLKIKKKLLGEDDSEFGNIYYNLGNLYKNMGDYISAEYFYVISLENRVKNYGDFHPDIASSLNNLGNLYLNTGNYKNSEKFYLSSLEVTKNTLGNIHPNVASTFNNLGALYKKMGNYQTAEKFFKLSIDVIKKMPEAEQLDLDNSLTIAVSLNNLGDLNFNFGNFKFAESYFEQSIELKKKIFNEDHPEYIGSLISFGNLYSKIGNNELAEFYYKRSLDLTIKSLGNHHPLMALSMTNLGSFYLEKGDFNASKTLLVKSLEVIGNSLGREHQEYAYGLYDLSHLYYKQENYKLVFPLCQESFIIRKTNLNANLSWLSIQEKQAYWQQEKDFYDNMNSFSVSAVDSVPSSTELSYNANLISKSLLLETSRELDQAIAQSSDVEMKAQFVEMKQLRKLYSKMQSEGSTNKEVMDRYKIQADSLDKILVNKLGEYAASKRKFEITWKDVQSNLTTSDASIEFARYYDNKDSLYKYMALVVRPGYEYPKLVCLGEEDVIRSAAQNKDFSALYKEAWKGIDSLLVGVKRVYYSPEGELNNVSFSALCTEEGNELVASNKEKNRGVVIGNNKTSTKACNAVLIDKYELHQLTTTRYLADGTLKKEKPMQPTLALVGGINFDDIPEQTKEADKEQSNEDFAFHANLNKRTASTNGKKRGKRSSSNYGKKMDLLPGTKEEVVNIAGLLNTSNWKVQTKSDKKAGEYEFKKDLETNAPSVLHIATHGFAFPDEAKQETKLMDMKQSSTYKVSEDPMVRCGLMLGGSNISWTGNPQKMIEQTGDDGILTAAEVANLDLSNTKLVVLSACETGLGKIEGSEGTFGLKRGFKLAGVEQMIVSLWSVPDKETMELMTLFYSDLTKTLNPVTSFEKAQKEMRTKYPTDPDKWAGFVLVR